jgi:large subunit ribosomal protein L15
MSLSLHTLKPQFGSKKSKKRVGRGLGSTGTYSGRGVKGQSARSGVSGLKLQGLRHIMLATPKTRGFKSGKTKSQVLNVSDLSKHFSSGSKVNPKILLSVGRIDSISTPVKILGSGVIAIPIVLTDCLVSASAKKKIEEAGGSVVSLS